MGHAGEAPSIATCAANLHSGRVGGMLAAFPVPNRPVKTNPCGTVAERSRSDRIPGRAPDSLTVELSQSDAKEPSQRWVPVYRESRIAWISSSCFCRKCPSRTPSYTAFPRQNGGCADASIRGLTLGANVPVVTQHARASGPAAVRGPATPPCPPLHAKRRPPGRRAREPAGLD